MDQNDFFFHYFFFGPLDIKNGFDAKCKNPEKSFMTKMVFFFILYGKNMTFLEKNHFWPQNHFSFFPYNTPLKNGKTALDLALQFNHPSVVALLVKEGTKGRGVGWCWGAFSCVWW